MFSWDTVSVRHLSVAQVITVTGQTHLSRVCGAFRLTQESLALLMTQS